MSARDEPDAHAILRSLDTGVVVIDAARHVLYANDAARRLLGRDDEQLDRLFAQDDPAAVVDLEGRSLALDQRPVGQAASKGAPVRGEIVGIRPPGVEARTWLVVDVVPMVGGAGDRLVVSFSRIGVELLDNRDLMLAATELEGIVQRRTAELSEANASLKQATSRYDAVIRAMSEGVCIIDMSGAILSANPSAERILGLSLEQMQGLRIADPQWAMVREDGTLLPYDQTPYETTRRTGEPGADQIIGVHRGAEDRAWISVNTDPIRVGDEMVGVVATFTDVTRERQMLRRLEETHRHLEWMNEMMPGVMMESFEGFDGTSRITYVSRNAEQVWGLSPEQMKADTSAAYLRMHPEDRAALDAFRADLRPDMGELESEFRVSDGRGGWRWVRSTTAAPRPAEGGLLFHTIQRDVTREHEMTLHLRESQRREAMGTLASGIAHNFNNMLAAILPSLERARAEVPGELGEELEAAFQAATAAGELVRRLARLSGREGDTDDVSIGLRDLLEEVVQLARRTFDRRVVLVAELPATSAHVLARRTDMQQVFLNLLLNARDAVLEVEAPRITVRLAAVGPGGRVEVEVEDNGVGMSAETQARLGEPFFTTKGVGQGTGLGLATVIGTLRDLGGELSWRSEVGRGAVFRVALPIVDPPAPATSKPRADDSGPLLSGRTVLCVDDEPLVRSSVARILRRLGAATVLEADGGEEALRQVDERDDLDLVVADLSMPGIGGDELIRRAKETRPALRALLMTGFLPDDTSGGADAVLLKPFTLRRMREVLRQVLNASTTAR